MWNNSIFEVERREKGRSFLMLEGRCTHNNQRLIIVNVYAPCDFAEKKALWDDIWQLKVSNSRGLWCVLGDFNSIRSLEERVSLSQRRVESQDISAFNQWISDMELQEIKSVGSNYTWIRPNGYVKSRLDRFLVSDQWLSVWPESCQHVLQRDLSDHCPTILQTNMVDWGPKPFRVFDWWLQQNQYQKMVRDTWCNDQQGGWGRFELWLLGKMLLSSNVIHICVMVVMLVRMIRTRSRRPDSSFGRTHSAGLPPKPANAPETD